MSTSFFNTCFPVDGHPGFHENQHAVIGFRRTQSVNAGNAGDDHHVPALEQGMGRGVAHFVDFVVDGRVFFDIRVGIGEIRFRLVVVVIADEITHRVFGEKGFELAVQLGRQGFIVRQDQRRFLQFLDHVGDGVGFPGAGHPQ